MRFISILLALVLTHTAYAEPPIRSPSIGQYGSAGLIDMPTADALPDGQIAITLSGFNDFQKLAFAFQISPRLTGVLRYSGLSNYTDTGARVLDRSFDLQYQLAAETKTRPALAIGLRDFMGTSIYSAQYFVASKQMRPKIRATIGAGWGRLSASHDLQDLDRGAGGVPSVDQWFRGPVGFFGGLEWDTPIRDLRAKIEYSSDLYTRENNVLRDSNLSGTPSFSRKNNWNAALSYRFKNGLEAELSYLYGDQVGLRFTQAIDPKARNSGYYDTAPLPLINRNEDEKSDRSWRQEHGIENKAFQQLQSLLAQEGQTLVQVQFSSTIAKVWIENTKYLASAQAIGRTARAMGFVFPASIEDFEIALVTEGLAIGKYTIRRSDLEMFQFDPKGHKKIANRMLLSTALPPAEHEMIYPKFTWSWGPFAQINFSDFNDSFGLDAGIRVRGRVHFSPNLSLGGAITKLLEADKTAPTNTTTQPRVRSNLGLYNAGGDPGIESLSLDYVKQVSPTLYGRLTVGYLESMFGGLSAELLWKDPRKPWAIGIELNAVKQRDFDRLFGFQNYNTVTGHVSGYFDLSSGYSAQIDVGRYLAGDWGGSLRFARSFANGWRLGAYATVTDMPRASFGEGSFDKGIFVEIPLATFSGVPTRAKFETGFRSVNADGGARLRIENRLYEKLREGDLIRTRETMARFWQ